MIKLRERLFKLPTDCEKREKEGRNEIMIDYCSNAPELM